jgi:Bifunctional DNA primase/polymerase, N-terminal
MGHSPVNPQGESGSFNCYAARLADNGFTVIPAKGKIPAVPKWQNPKPTDLQWLSKMLAKDRYADHNLGIVCGRVVGIDIDEDNRAEVERLEALAVEHLGPTLFQRVGCAPHTLLLYRPADEIPSHKIGGCIDVLSGGRYFVAYGIHPDTQQPYRWIDNRHAPATAKIDNLPVITAASLAAFADAVCATLGRPLKGVPTPSLQTADLKTRQRTCHVEMLSGSLGTRIERDAQGRVVDGREAFMTSLTAAEYARHAQASPDELGNRVWARFVAEADLLRPKGSDPRCRWSSRDALSKAREICRRKPDLKSPRRSRGCHPASHLHAWRKMGYWTAEQRALHLAEVARHITTPVTVMVARIMIEAVDHATGFCAMSIADIAKRASCSTKSVKMARKALTECGFWIAVRGVFVPL